MMGFFDKDKKDDVRLILDVLKDPGIDKPLKMSTVKFIIQVRQRNRSAKRAIVLLIISIVGFISVVTLLKTEQFTNDLIVGALIGWGGAFLTMIGTAFNFEFGGSSNDLEYITNQVNTQRDTLSDSDTMG